MKITSHFYIYPLFILLGSQCLCAQQSHQIKSGETLFFIARKYGVSVEAISAANPTLQPDKLTAGTSVLIPTAGANNTITATKQDDNTAVSADGMFEHVVQSGQTLYGIARMYDVQWPLLSRLNPQLQNQTHVNVGHVLKIPQSRYYLYDPNGGKNITTSPPSKSGNIVRNTVKVKLGENAYDITAVSLPNENVSRTPAAVAAAQHRVAAKETLYSIAKRYGVSIGDLKVWNRLESDALNEGQLLWIQKPQSSLTANENPNNTVNISNALSIGSPLQERYVSCENNKADYTFKRGRGKGSGIKDDQQYGSKFLALSKQIPPRTIVKVINPMNRRTVYVEVVAPLPDIGENHDIALKLTSAAVQQLNLRDDKFLVEWSYYIEK
ncbi:MAG: LysM peptidoglycan-binding domain-containing protein [Sphingobacteriales bacterium]|nr:LysM peptidoglycan-binding domain-containing protein [Sphingobacteriales bacterium]